MRLWGRWFKLHGQQDTTFKPFQQPKILGRRTAELARLVRVG